MIHEDKVDLSNQDEVVEKIKDLYEEGYKFITIDFENTEVIDYSALAKLLEIHKKLKERGGKLKFTNINSEILTNMLQEIKHGE